MSTAPSLLKELHLKTTRLHFANVLVAVDLSASSANTLKIAADLAYQHGSRLIVAHVMDDSAGAAFGSAAEIENRIRLWMKPHLKNDARHAIAVVKGDVMREISGLLEKYCADLLIVGTHASTNVERLVLGSKAEALLRTISIPVLTIGPHVRNYRTEFASIVLPTDLQPDSLRATQYAVAMAEEANATLTLLHVFKKVEGGDSRESIYPKMQQLVPEDSALWCKPVFRVESGDLTETILATAEQARADLIVLAVTHAQLLVDHAHWSTTSRVVRFAECPVLTVRDHL
jgi:nucleotide-binding universal stress UspA family protein